MAKNRSSQLKEWISALAEVLPVAAGMRPDVGQITHWAQGSLLLTTDLTLRNVYIDRLR